MLVTSFISRSFRWLFLQEWAKKYFYLNFLKRSKFYSLTPKLLGNQKIRQMLRNLSTESAPVFLSFIYLLYFTANLLLIVRRISFYVFDAWLIWMQHQSATCMPIPPSYLGPITVINVWQYIFSMLQSHSSLSWSELRIWLGLHNDILLVNVRRRSRCGFGAFYWSSA